MQRVISMQSFRLALALIGCLGICVFSLRGIAHADEKPLLHFPPSLKGFNVQINDHVTGGCFLRPQTARDYLVEKLAARGIEIVEESKIPNVKVVMNFVGKRYDGLCEAQMDLTIYYPILYSSKGSFYDGLVYLGGSAASFYDRISVDASVIEGINSFILYAISMTEHVR